MRPELQAKLLQHMNKKKGDQGFTLVELLVVIVIIGVLTAIALPSFLNQTVKAKQSEAKQKVSTMIKAQQSWRTENPSFTTAIEDLALGKLESAGSAPIYTYSLDNTTVTGTVIAISAGVRAASNDVTVKSYSGRVDVTDQAATGGVTNKVWNSIVCEADVPGTTVLNAPSGVNTSGSNVCPGISAKLTK
jgi:type IV pilus assembly protein PilA